MRGTTPLGARDEREAAAWVRAMFARVAHRYDLANHLLSFNLDRLWRARVARRVSRILDRPEARVLDICCGTGDLLLALARQGNNLNQIARGINRANLAAAAVPICSAE